MDTTINGWTRDEIEATCDALQGIETWDRITPDMIGWQMADADQHDAHDARPDDHSGGNYPTTCSPNNACTLSAIARPSLACSAASR